MTDRPAMSTPQPDATPVATGETLGAGASVDEEAPPRPSPFRVLKNGEFRRVWVASLGSNVGGWMEFVGMQWAMTQATLAPEWEASGRPGAPIMMGYLATAQMAPVLLMGMLGGVVADRVDRKKLLVWTQTLMMLVAAALCIEAFRGAITPITLIVLGAIHGTVLAFNMPAWGVLTPRLVPRDQLADAIMLNGLQFNLARVIGPAVGGVLLGWLGAPWMFLINTISFIGVIWAVAVTPPSPAPTTAPAHPWRAIAEAFSFSFRNKGARALILAIFLFSMLGTPLLRLMPIVVAESYKAKADGFGLLLALMGAGAVTGALTIRLIPRWYPRHHLIPLSVMMGGLFTALTAAAPSLATSALCIYFCGIFWLWTFNPAFAALQLLVADEMRGRVMSIANVLSFGAMPLGTLLAGYIGEVASGRAGDGFGSQVGLGVNALILTVAGLVMLAWRTPEVDGLAPGQPGYDRTPGLIRGLTGSAHRGKN
ncbi:MAG: MFS transporter [Planctomycetota bacterium]|nr:MFS transporter [Planctomycetota bacterium]